MNKNIFNVDYFFKKRGSAGKGTRQHVSGSSQFNLKTSTSDFAVQKYLEDRHQGCEIEIMSIQWN